jgi:hypothetical protein
LFSAGERQALSKPSFGRSYWDQSAIDTARVAERPWVFTFLTTVFTGAGVVVSTLIFDSTHLPTVILAGVVGGFLGVVALDLVLRAGFFLAAPYKQRTEARRYLSDVTDLKRLVLLERHLMILREVTIRTVEAVRAEGRAGPVGSDAFGNPNETWLLGENTQLRLFLENEGFPELVPQLVLGNPPLDTWEEVDAAGWERARRITRCLESDLFTEVRSLDPKLGVWEVMGKTINDR